MRRRPAALALCLAAVLAAGACGGGGDEDEITGVLETGFTTTDAKVRCEQSLSAGLVERIYGDTAACRKIEGEDAKNDARATSVDVSDIEIDGDRATATIKLDGGLRSGATGPIALTSSGGDWRIDDLGVAFLRSQLQAAMKHDNELDERIRTCLGEKMLELPDREFRALAYGTIGEQPDAQQRLVGMLGECEAAQGGGENVSLMREKFEEGIARSLRKNGASADEIACVNRRLRELIDDEELSRLVGQAADEVPRQVTAAAARAIETCEASGPGG
jgi:hypothetical protein